MSKLDPLSFDPKGDDFMNSPFEFYRCLRAQTPVYLDPRYNIYFVASFDLANEVMRDSKRFSSLVDRASMRRGGIPQAVQDIRKQAWPLALTLSNNDAPGHDIYKELVAPWFAPRNLNRFEPFVLQRVGELVESLPLGEPFDFVETFSVPLPVSVIGQALGLRDHGDAQLKTWSDAFADEIGLLTSEDRAIEIARLTLDCHRAMVARCEERRISPQSDIISMLVRARIPVDLLGVPEHAGQDVGAAEANQERPLETSELLSILTQLLVAGNETTTNSLSGGMRRLAANFELHSRLRSQPELIPRFVEEILRLESPVQGQFRKANCATTLGGVDMPQGALLHIRLASANRDETRYGPDDDCVNLENTKPVPHKAFGMGMHFCVGAMLSRLELKIAFASLIERFSRIEIAEPTETLRYHTHFHLRGLERLPLVLG